MSMMALITYIVVSVFALAYVIFFIVITIGGFFDLIYLIKGIQTEVVDAMDDGRVPQRPGKAGS